MRSLNLWVPGCGFELTQLHAPSGEHAHRRPASLRVFRAVRNDISRRAAEHDDCKGRLVSVNGIRLHYVDWGGAGPSLLFLTGLGDSAHSFDRLAAGFTDRFHVLGLTRRGQGKSDKPPSGYDPRSLAEDIRAFLDVMKIQRVTLAGFSVAGSEETLFAGTYPARVDKLVYLDSAEDYKSGYELATNPLTAYPLPLPSPGGPLGEIVKGSQQHDPDYTQIVAPALSFVTIYDAP